MRCSGYFNFVCLLKALISDISLASPVVKRIGLRIPSLHEVDFKPGQFVAIHFPDLPEGNNERSYSIANPPDQSNRLELCVVINPDGAATPILWKLGVNDVLEVSEPKGNFVLPEKIETELVFICTGTG